VRGYDTLFVQRVKTATYQHAALRSFAKACIRKQQPISEVAQAFGVSRTTVYNWLTGRTVPHARYLNLIKDALAIAKRK
jgi:transcriptional regulator with XRE-family HTH domain